MTHSKETRAKISLSLKGIFAGSKNPMFGKRGELSPSFGRHHSEETKAKLREQKLGNRNPMFGKHLSDKTMRMLKENIGEKNPAWKGDNATKHTGRTRAEKLYPCPNGMERHHIDGNPLNNAPENIQFVTKKQHFRLDNHPKKNGKFTKKESRPCTENPV